MGERQMSEGDPDLDLGLLKQRFEREVRVREISSIKLVVNGGDGSRSADEVERNSGFEGESLRLQMLFGGSLDRRGRRSCRSVFRQAHGNVAIPMLLLMEKGDAGVQMCPQ